MKQIKNVTLLLAAALLLFGCSMEQGTNLTETTQAQVEAGDIERAYGDPVVDLFRDHKYQGSKVSLAVGEYTLADLKAKGMRDNDITSIRISPGYAVYVYPYDNFGGDKKIFEVWKYTKSVSNLGDKWMNDALSSIKVVRYEEETSIKWHNLTMDNISTYAQCLSVQNGRYIVFYKTPGSSLNGGLIELEFGDPHRPYWWDNAGLVSNIPEEPVKILNGWDQVYTINKSDNKVSRIDLTKKRFYNDIIGKTARDIAIDYNRRHLYVLSSDGMYIRKYDINGDYYGRYPRRIVTYNLASSKFARSAKYYKIAIHKDGYPVVCTKTSLMITVPSTALNSYIRDGVRTNFTTKGYREIPTLGFMRGDFEGSEYYIGAFNMNIRGSHYSRIFAQKNGVSKRMYYRKETNGPFIIDAQIDDNGYLWRLDSDDELYVSDKSMIYQKW